MKACQTGQWVNNEFQTVLNRISASRSNKTGQTLRFYKLKNIALFILYVFHCLSLPLCLVPDNMYVWMFKRVRVCCVCVIFHVSALCLLYDTWQRYWNTLLHVEHTMRLCTQSSFLTRHHSSLSLSVTLTLSFWPANALSCNRENVKIRSIANILI